MGEMQRDAQQVQQKVLALAKAMPDAAMEWRPAPGVRTTAEVFQHIAADNYYLPALLGVSAPAATGINKDFKSAQAFEQKKRDRAAVMAELEGSFAFLQKVMSSTTEAQLGSEVDFFGRKNTTRGVWLATLTHLHEHLGQLIAYARANKVTPPWSK